MEVVLVGAGHAHLEALRRLTGRGGLPGGARLTLVTRGSRTTYSGMLPGVIAGIYRAEEALIDAAHVAAAAGAGLILDEVTGIDALRRSVHRRRGAPLGYDLLSLDIGSAPGGRGIPGVAEHAIAVKPIERLPAHIEAVRRRSLDAGGRLRVGVVGGGAGGVELILSLERRLRRDAAAAALAVPGFTLVTASTEILPTFPARLRRRLAALLVARGIGVITGGRVVAVEVDAVEVEGRSRLGLDAALWCTEAAPAPWLAETGLALDGDGFIEVLETLQSVSHADVRAAGDSATVRGHPRPRSGVYAVRAGPLIAANIARLVRGRRPIGRRPRRQGLALISTGERYALGPTALPSRAPGSGGSRTPSTGASWRASRSCRRQRSPDDVSRRRPRRNRPVSAARLRRQLFRPVNPLVRLALFSERAAAMLPHSAVPMPATVSRPQHGRLCRLQHSPTWGQVSGQPHRIVAARSRKVEGITLCAYATGHRLPRSSPARSRCS